MGFMQKEKISINRDPKTLQPYLREKNTKGLK